jgi:hypothetical protein
VTLEPAPATPVQVTASTAVFSLGLTVAPPGTAVVSNAGGACATRVRWQTVEGAAVDLPCEDLPLVGPTRNRVP